MEKVNLKNYLEAKGLSRVAFVAMTGISMPTLNRIILDADRGINTDVARKIYHTTLKEYGTGLGVWEYINL